MTQDSYSGEIDGLAAPPPENWQSRGVGGGAEGRRDEGGEGRASSEAQGETPGLIFTFRHKQRPDIPSNAAPRVQVPECIHPGLFYRTINACKVCSDLFLNRSHLGRDFESEPKAPT